ncbi:hypothetical protein [Streptomyces diastatochromogenes]|uniref:hypothetical protein n=1 Tax=Streptomyces diastatochromogenes TaxID=42236 RepID=UPI0036CBD0A9
MASASSPPLVVKSVVGGGLEDKSWSSAISDLQIQLRGVRAVESDPFGLTVTFFVPGEVYAPKFSGLRIGSYLEDYRTLVVQVALPEHPDRDAKAELLALLGKAVERAEAWGRRKKLLSGPLAGSRGAIANLA